MVPYYGDYPEDHTEIRIPFNTFDSNDPSASVTITNLADADIKVHADGSLTQIATDGASVTIDFDSVTGNHMVLIDSSAHADYTTGTEYAVRIEGTTVDAATINGWIGTFSIERAGGVLAYLKAGSTVAASVTGAVGSVTGAVGSVTGAVGSVTGSVGSVTGHTNQTADHTAGIADIPTVAEFNARTLVAAGYFDPAADTVATVTTVGTTTTNTDMRGTDNAALAALFTGITSVAEWLGLIAGKQVGNTTARTELRATGAGAGTYDETADSLEALEAVAGAIPTTAMRGTDSAATEAKQDAQDAIITEARLAELDAANLPADVDNILTDTADMQPKLGTPAADVSADIAAVKVDTGTTIPALLPSALTAGGNIKADVIAISGDTTAADRLEAMMDGLLVGQINGGVPTTTAFVVDGDVGNGFDIDDFYIGRLITFTTGTLIGQQTDVTDWDGGTKVLTVTAMTTAPSNDDFFIMH